MPSTLSSKACEKPTNRRTALRSGAEMSLWVVFAATVPAICNAQARTVSALPLSPVPGAALSLSLGPRVNVVYEQRRLQDLGQPIDLPVRPARNRLGMEFRSPAASQGPRGILRLQLSGDSALNFRPRGGGMAVTYRSSF
jgi:hypothetical protein